ncbi:hypothetical protein [Flavobacterium fluviatile]|uniref:hypothetical protein n=1 Tax=Flavobacterium fluviatile TaxID=1862387 RepID=UPI0013D43548|nr:hypothetical protein [Flavobacterium fluviatile]
MYNTAIFHTVLAFLGMVIGSLTEQLQSDLNNSRVALDDQTLYIKKQISGGGTIDLIDATTNRVDGICSFDKNILQTGRAFIFDQVSIGYASDAAVGKEGVLKYNSAVPAPLYNAEFLIIQNGKEILRKPVADLHNLAAGNSVNDQYTLMKSLRLLVDNKTIEIKLKFPTGVAMDDTSLKHYVYVRLNGLQTAVKA